MNNKYLLLLSKKKLFIVLAIIAIVPFLLLSFFNNPASDDFEFSHMTKIMGYANVQGWRYNNEGGRFFSNGILSANPLVYNNYFGFKIIPILILLFFVFSIKFFVANALRFVSKKEQWVITSAVFFLFLYQLPDPCQGFYWITGAITYQLPLSLSLLLYGFLLKFYHTRKIGYYGIALVLLLCTIGCTELVALLLIFINFCVLAIHYERNRKLEFPLLLFFISTIGFSAIVLLAPGNAVRAQLIKENHHLFYSLFKALLFTFSYALRWFPFLLLCGLFLIKFSYRLIDNTANKKWFIHPLLAFLMLFGLLYIALFLGFWSLNNVLPDRAMNTISFYFIFVAVYALLCTVYYLKANHNYTITLPKNAKYGLGLTIVIFTFSNTTIFRAYHDLLIGKAYKYDVEMHKRYTFIVKAKEDKVAIPALVNKPYTIYNQEIMGVTTDATNWKNLEVSKYYNKEIVVIPSDSLFTE